MANINRLVVSFNNLNVARVFGVRESTRHYVGWVVLITSCTPISASLSSYVMNRQKNGAS